MLGLKFVINLEILGKFLGAPTFEYYNGFIKLGVYDYNNLGQVFVYMLPEILIMALLLFNEIQLKLLGLFYNIEQDIETVTDAIQRNIQGGHHGDAKLKKKQNTNMVLSFSFRSTQEQLNAMNAKANEEQEDLEVVEEEPLGEDDGQVQIKEQTSLTEPVKVVPLKDRQMEAFKKVSNSVWKCSRKFDIDQSSNSTMSAFDALVRENVLQKSLESDNLLIVEGMPRKDKPEFIDQATLDEDYSNARAVDCVSAGDFEGELCDKLDQIEERSQPKLGLFEKQRYFDKLFPAFTIQKPGYDLYGTTTIFLAILALYVFIFYGKLSVDQANYLQNSAGNNIFKGDMVICLLIVITVIIIERYVNRSDTKAVEKKSLVEETDPSFFDKDDFFGKASTNRSMTIKLQKQQTQDLNLQNNEVIKKMFGEEDNGGQFDQSRTKITTQQKTKYVVHILILVAAHIFVFWFIPITGNIKLYATPVCNTEQEQYYGCKNFHNNVYLQIFYIIICFYLLLSALQIRYGFPIHKKPSSILQYDDNPIALIGAQVFQAIPFAVEIRCLLDFTFSKTSLDIFQFWQLWQYHFDLYAAKNGNISYTKKVLGSPTALLDKCVFGCLISTVILMLLVGPLIFFSDVGGFIAPNPVLSGDIQYSFVITKLVSERDLETAAPKHYKAGEVSEVALGTDSLADWNDSQTQLLFDSADATTLA